MEKAREFESGSRLSEIVHSKVEEFLTRAACTKVDTEAKDGGRATRGVKSFAWLIATVDKASAKLRVSFSCFLCAGPFTIHYVILYMTLSSSPQNPSANNSTFPTAKPKMLDHSKR